MKRMSAGLWPRLLAFALDYFLIAAYLLVLVAAALVARAVAPDAVASVFGNPLTAEAVGFVLLTLPVALYFALSEASVAGATFGKRRLTLRVVTGHWRRLSLGRSAARTALKFVPWELTHALVWRYALAQGDPPGYLDIGLIVVWVLIGANVAAVIGDRQHRALYDMIAGTKVVHSGPIH